MTMRKRSGTLEIGFRSGGRPDDYEGEYQCFATNEFGVALSNKILLRVSSKNSRDAERFTGTHNVVHSFDFQVSFACVCEQCVATLCRMMHFYLQCSLWTRNVWFPSTAWK